MRDQFVVDTHAHFYSMFNVDRFVESSARLCDRGCVGCICLASTGDEHPLDAFREATRDRNTDWTVMETLESDSVVVTWDGKLPIVVLASRQIVTREGLEVLALGTAAGIDDGESLGSTIEQVRRTGAIPVIPWGVGKWSFARRRHLIEFLSDASRRREVFLGDIPSRTRWLGDGLTESLRGEVRWLHGSDPLPIRGADRTVARLASQIHGTIDLQRPLASTATAIRRLKETPGWIGEYDSVKTMVSDQIRLRGRRAG